MIRDGTLFQLLLKIVVSPSKRQGHMKDIRHNWTKEEIKEIYERPLLQLVLDAADVHRYNHTIDTSAEHYGELITTRTYDDGLNTLAHVRKAGIPVCSGGIIGLGETDADRIGMLHTLANLPQHPESVPINALVPVAGTPL